MGALRTILSLRRSVLTMMVVMVLAGIFTYLTIPKEADPDIDVPVFYISIPHQGISPEDAERLLVRPMETHLRGLDGLKELTAIASQGHAGIIAEFNIESDHDKAGTDLREKVDQAKAELPAEADEPVVNEINLSLFPVLVVALSGNVPERTLYQHAKRLQDEIEGISSVLEARLTGHRDELLEVVIDPGRLESYNITQDELIRTVTNNNRLVAAGFIDNGNGRFNVKVPGLFESASDVFGLPIKVSDQGVVTLSDVASIRRTFQDPSAYSRFNGEPAIAIQVIKRTGTNIVENNNEVRRVVEEFTTKWPDAIKVEFALDQSKTIHEVLGSLQASILSAIALVMIVVVAALGLRSGLLVGLAIPTSFMIGFLIIGLTGMTVNMMLMFGLVLTVGILVDGAIVVVEYADRKMAEGMHRREAYLLAAERMFWPVVSSTLTTLAAFLPLLLWPGVPGEFMSYLPITVIYVLSASLITAMIFLPVLGSVMGKSAATGDDVEAARRLSGKAPIDFAAIGGFTGLYVRILRRLIMNPAKVLVVASAMVVGTFYYFGKHNNGVEFFVDTEPEQVIAFVSARGNLSADDQLKLVQEVEAEILKVDGVKSVFTTTGSGGGGPDMGTGVSDAPSDQIGQMTIELADYDTRRRGKVLLAEMRERTANIPGLVVEIRKREDGPPTGKAIKLEIRGGDRAAVETMTKGVRQHLETGMGGLRDLEDSRPLPGIEWVLSVDRKEAGRYGADVVSVGAMIQMVTNGILVGKYRPDDSTDEVDIRVRLPAGDRTIDQLDQMRLMTPNGLVPIANFVTRKAEPKVSTIERKDGRYVMTVKAAVEDGILPDTKVKELDTWLKAEIARGAVPDGIAFRFRGADEEQKESGEFLGKAMAGALFLMFIILVTQFNSFYQTFITLSTIVLSMVGVLIGMLLTGQTFSIIMTGTGVIALAGIVVNNAIVLIDTFNRLREDGLEIIDAALKTSAQRLRPILLTTITTMLGLMPMAFSVVTDYFERTIQIGSVTSAWWVQLSTAIIFGLGFSTLLTLVLTPVLLTMPEVYRQRWAELRASWQAWRQRRSDGANTPKPTRAAGGWRGTGQGDLPSGSLPGPAE